MTITNEELTKSVTAVKKSMADWGKLPGELEKKYKELQDNPIASAVIDFDEANRRYLAAKAGLAKVLAIFNEVVDGIEAPYLFVTYAADWQGVAGKARAVAGIINDEKVSMEGHWRGDAKDAYTASHGNQKSAMNCISDQLADKVHDHLLTLARSGHTLYSDIVNAIAEYFATVTAAIVDVATVVGSLEAIGKVGELAGLVFTTMSTILTSAVGNLQEQSIISNEFRNLRNNPHGMINNRWPGSGATSFSNPEKWKWEAE
ncbi:hypothetical protein ACFWU5_28290 [Nocardia sp. NPDC058640]|uniref:hypothetical protein n=1 Tax=Nocardia sp. NPDC058640 TaxID=3346571 RepID=UPI003667E805